MQTKAVRQRIAYLQGRVETLETVAASMLAALKFDKSRPLGDEAAFEAERKRDAAIAAAEAAGIKVEG